MTTVFPTPSGVRLKGFCVGPIHDDHTNELTSVLSKMRRTDTGQPETTSAVRSAVGYERTISVRTDDGYAWGAGHVFGVGRGHVVVLIPRAVRRTPTEGYVFDRPACYYMTEGPIAALDGRAIMLRVIQALRQVIPGYGR